MDNKKIIFLLGMIILLPLASADLGENCFGGMMTGVYGEYGAGMMIFSWIFGLIVLVALILLIVWLIKQIQKK